MERKPKETCSTLLLSRARPPVGLRQRLAGRGQGVGRRQRHRLELGRRDEPLQVQLAGPPPPGHQPPHLARYASVL